MRLSRETFDHWCGRFALTVSYVGIAFVAGFFSIIWGIV